MNKRANDSYLYNYYDRDDGDGEPIFIEVGGYKVQVGINVVILPGFNITPSEKSSGATTVIGSNSFIGKNITLEEGTVLPNRTILEGEKMNQCSDPFAKVNLVFDDFGRTKENNEAILAFYQQAPVHHLSLMVNRGEATEEAVKLVEDNVIDPRHVGLHLNLTEGFPLSPNKKEKWYSVNQKGSLGQILVSRRAAIFLKRKEKITIISEVKSQIDKFRSLGFEPHFIDSHGNILFQWPLSKLLTPILIREGFTSIRIPRAEKNKHKLYDLLFKSRVKRLFRKNFNTADCFVNASDILKSDLSKYDGKTIEIMIHPTIKNGVMINRRDIDLPVLMAFLKSMNIQVLTSTKSR